MKYPILVLFWGHEGFAVVLAPWRFFLLFLLTIWFLLVSCAVNFSGPCSLYMTTSFHMITYTHIPVSSHSLRRQAWLWACICLQRHGSLALDKVPSLIYTSPWPLLQPVSHHLFYICTLSEQACDASSTQSISVDKRYSGFCKMKWFIPPQF